MKQRGSSAAANLGSALCDSILVCIGQNTTYKKNENWIPAIADTIKKTTLL
jgi:hypothetical protein